MRKRTYPTRPGPALALLEKEFELRQTLRQRQGPHGT